MCPSYKFVVRLMRPILDRPKSVSLMWPIEVMRRLNEKSKVKLLRKLSRRSFLKCRLMLLGSSPKVSLLSLVRLEVSMHDAIVMQVLQSQDGLRKVHACHFNR